MKRKALALVLSFAMLMTVCVPSTLATESTAQSTLVCEKSEHTHTDDCYAVSDAPTCGKEEGESAHSHDESCYEERQELTCTLPEDETHTHDDGCYTTESELTCGKTESDGHVHTDACYSRELICGLEEHQHGAECYEVVPSATTPSDAVPSESTKPSGTTPSDEPVKSDPSEPICNCGSEDGIHAENCPMYVEPKMEVNNTLDIPDGAVCIARVDEVQTLEMNPGDTVTFAFVDEVPDFVLWKLGTTPWAELDPEADTWGDVAALEAMCDYTLPEEAASGEKYAIGVLWHDAGISDIGQLTPEMVDTVAVITVAGEIGGSEVKGETESGVAVTVEGNLPEGAALALSHDVSDAEVEDALGTDAYTSQLLGAFDISVLDKDGVEWQPENGQSVRVTLDAAAMGLEDGHDYVITHVHEDEYSNKTITDFAAVPYGGEMTFELDGFSYILVFDGQTEINNIETFYRAELETINGADSTNGQLTFLGVYYDEQNQAHFLLAAAGNTTATAVDSKVKSIQLDGLNIPKNQMNYQPVDKKISRIEIKNDNGELIHTIVVTGKLGTYGGYYDITLPENTVVRNGFEFGVNGDQSGNGWKIGGLVNIDLEYNLTKKVAAGSTADDASFTNSLTVDRGDWVIYKITVANTGTQALNGMIVTDALPMDAFVADTIEMGVGDENGNIPNWVPFNKILFDNYDSPGRFTRSIYIRAQVKPDLNIATATTYTNTAYINGMNMPEQSDTATITVNPPKMGTLVVSKEVTSENPLDPAPGTAFSFTVTDAAGKTYPTFELKSGESHQIPNFPVGGFTVVETNADGYTTKVNGQSGATFEGTMVADNPPVVAFENQFSTRNTGLSITKKVEKAYDNDVLPPNDTFSFVVNITGEGIPTEYNYTTSAGRSGSIKIGTDVEAERTISLKANETATITGIPVGASYEVREVLNGNYTLASVTGGAADADIQNGTSGTFGTGEAALTFTNIYKRHLADLTISKTGVETIDENQTFIFRVVCEETGVDMRVVLNGEDGWTKTIKDLPIGSYTVTEETEWSWRYEPADGAQIVELGAANNYSGSADFENTRRTETNYPDGNTDWKWLNGAAYKKNKFAGIE